MGLTNQEAIKILKANYPTPNYSELCEAVDMAIALLRSKDETANNLPFQRHDCGALIVYRGRDVCPNCGRKVEWND